MRAVFHGSGFQVASLYKQDQHLLCGGFLHNSYTTQLCLGPHPLVKAKTGARTTSYAFFSCRNPRGGLSLLFNGAHLRCSFSIQLTSAQQRSNAMQIRSEHAGREEKGKREDKETSLVMRNPPGAVRCFKSKKKRELQAWPSCRMIRILQL